MAEMNIRIDTSELFEFLAHLKQWHCSLQVDLSEQVCREIDALNDAGQLVDTIFEGANGAAVPSPQFFDLVGRYGYDFGISHIDGWERVLCRRCSSDGLLLNGLSRRTDQIGFVETLPSADMTLPGRGFLGLIVGIIRCVKNAIGAAG